MLRPSCHPALMWQSCKQLPPPTMQDRLRSISGSAAALGTPADVTTAVLLAQNDLAIRMAMLALMSRTNPVQVGRVLGLLDELADLVDRCEHDLHSSVMCC
jgi:hypothetical protein